jgi:hypothetical protein
MYNIDAFKLHIKQDHIQCDICKKDYPYMVYKDYPALRQHFEMSHYFCKEPECIENMTVVFATKEELDYHNTKTHSKRAGKEVNANALLGTNFNNDSDGDDDGYYVQSSRGGRGGRGGGATRGGRGGGNAGIPQAPKGGIQLYDKIGKDFTKIVILKLPLVQIL